MSTQHKNWPWSIGRSLSLHSRAEVAFEALCESAVSQIDNFVPQNLVQVMWACGTSGYRHEGFLRGAARVAKRTVNEFSSQHLSNFLWACARLNFNEDPELLRCFSEASVPRVHEGTPQHLSNIAWAASMLGPEHFQDCLAATVAETSRRLEEFDAPSLMMLSDSLFEAKYGEGRHEPLLGVLRNHVLRMGQDLYTVLTEYLPPRKGCGSTQQIVDYQQRLRSVGLVTFGYEHTNSLFSRLQLAETRGWNAEDAWALPGWTTNARRTTVARRYQITVGQEVLQDSGTVFTSAFASAAEDIEAELTVVWLGHGKADSPSVGRAGRSGDAEFRAIDDTYQILKRTMQEQGSESVMGTIEFHASGVPCLSCVGVAAQFKRLFPGLAIHISFEQRLEVGLELAAAPHDRRARPATPGAPSDLAEIESQVKAMTVEEPEDPDEAARRAVVARRAAMQKRPSSRGPPVNRNFDVERRPSAGLQASPLFAGRRTS